MQVKPHERRPEAAINSPKSRFKRFLHEIVNCRIYLFFLFLFVCLNNIQTYRLIVLNFNRLNDSVVALVACSWCERNTAK